MREVIKSNHDLCTGCNRCVRECPMETANITYQDEDGNIKVKIDDDKCIACGRCVTACKHNARYYEDDTMRFFNDLKDGAPISLITAPAIRTNIPEYRRLFTYLKRLGIKKIYDVSLGADICIWGYVRYCKNNIGKQIITQPCPVIVTYCEQYRQDLLANLAPVQSPMASLAIYMKEYEGITDSIAALSPCIAKKQEFESTGLSQYNVTFSRLQEYLNENNIELPYEETGFDNYECGLGSMFPMPGGLKENIEFFTGKTLSIDRAEGYNVYEKLDIYASSPPEALPHIFDVLNCDEGCNIGPASTHTSNVFEVNRRMDASRRAATDSRKKEYYEELYRKYDETFDLSHFMRKYKPNTKPIPQITERDIEEAFVLLNKTTHEKQNVDCGACGSDSCHSMARKIALGVNIPINCIVRTMETAEEEHKSNVNSLEQFAMIWNSIESGSMIVDAETRLILDVNPATERMYGGVKENLVGQTCYKLFGQHECPIIDMDQTIDREERNFLKADGTSMPVLKSVSKIEYNGRPALLESFTDISYLKELEEQKSMLDATDRMKVMLDATPLCAHFWNRDLEMIDCNQEALRLFNVSGKQEYIERYNELSPQYQPDGRLSKEASAQLIQKTFEEGYQRFEWMRQTLDGEPIPVEVILVRVDYHGENLVAGYTRDLRAQKAMIQEINETAARLKAVVSNYSGTIWSVDRDNTITLFDGQFIKSIGIAPQFLEGKNLDLARRKSRHLDVIERVEKTFTGESQDWISEVDGKLFRSHTAPIHDEDGNVAGVVGNMEDMTEILTLQKELELALVKAEAANKAKSDFLSTMSHEIRTPMNAILGITEIQLQNEALEKDIKEALGKIYSSGDLLLGIINDILDLSKIEAGKLELAPAKYEIASLVSDTAQLNMMRIGSKPIEFELYIDENLPTLLTGDELRVKQILNNLLSNAFKYTAEGMVKLSVSSEPIIDNDENVLLIVSVSDTGQGMTEEEVSKLFDEYSRFNTEANRTTEGTGLGMSITRNLISLMNGEIFIESCPGKGSTFTVRIPQGKINSEVLGSEMAENLHQFRTSNRAQMKRVQITREPMPYGSVLIVDDVETNIYVAKGLLAPYGLQIDSADSGYAAIEKIENGNEYDIVFMDHMMPKMDGIEATRRIRDLGYGRSIVALTANAVAGQADIFLENGFDDFISKPIDVRQLNIVLNKLIRDKQEPEVLESVRRKAAESENESAADSVNVAIDPYFAEIFMRDAKKALAVLNAISEEGNYSDKDVLRTYVINVHGMKSALANIKETELSAAALRLEAAGRDENFEIVAAETPGFLRSLSNFVDQLATISENTVIEASDGDQLILNEMLQTIRSACEEYDEITAEEALSELQGSSWPDPARQLLNTIAEYLLHSDFDEIVETIEKWTLSDS